jgi:S1-C subfamily serine protease
VTNEHVVGGASIGTYFVTFDNGQQAEAKLAYYDVWQDQAILKVNPEDVPKTVEEISFTADQPSLNQSVFIIGNNEGQEFSIHNGILSNLYDINGAMPQHSYIISLNAAGGSSGSPILNLKGQAIGLNYGSGGTFAIALKGEYVTKALDALKARKMPKRQHIGVICQLYSLDKAVKHRNFLKMSWINILKIFQIREIEL